MDRWISKPLRDITTKIGSGATPKGGKASYKTDGIYLIRSMNVHDGYFTAKDIAALDDEQAKVLAHVDVEPHDVLLNITGASIARCCRAPAEYLPARVNQHVAIIRPRIDIIDPGFLTYLLISKQYKDALLHTGDKAGATRQALTKAQLQEFVVSFPESISEQQRIVQTLDDIFSAIDLAIANTKRMALNARELFDSYLDATFRRICVKTSTAQISSLCNADRVITYGVIKLGEHQADGVPCLRTSNVRWLHVDEKCMKQIAPALSQQYRRTILQGGEVLVNVRGTLGGVAVAQSHMAGWNVSREVAVVPIDQSRAKPDFVAFCIAARSSQAWLTGVLKGVAYTGINIEDLRDLRIPLPSMGEQDSIVKALSTTLGYCRNLETAYERRLALLRDLKRSLLQQAFSGTLRPIISESSIETVASASLGAQVLILAHHRHEMKNRQKTFGRVKAQKTLHLVESEGRIELGRAPIKDAAGPNDSVHQRRIEDWARENRIFEFVKRGSGYEFRKLARYDAFLSEALIDTKPHQEKLYRVIEPLVPMNSQQAEVVATVHAAWNNLILDGHANPADDVIVRSARDHWHDSKLKIPEASFRKAIQQIRKLGWVPDGSAKRVTGQERLI